MYVYFDPVWLNVGDKQRVQSMVLITPFLIFFHTIFFVTDWNRIDTHQNYTNILFTCTNSSCILILYQKYYGMLLYYFMMGIKNTVFFFFYTSDMEVGKNRYLNGVYIISCFTCNTCIHIKSTQMLFSPLLLHL
jgi:hypothetical protein